MPKEFKKDNITVYNADCMDVMKDYPDNYFDLAVVDPPYGIKRFENGIGENDRYKIKASAIFNNGKPDDEYFIELFRVSNNQIIWGANNFELPPTEYFCIWNKKQTVDNFASAEYAWVSMGLKKPAKIFEYSIQQYNADKWKIHPTQKPVKLYSWIYQNYSSPEHKILDTHLGSGSNAIAAHYFGISEFIGVELDEDYFASFCKRYNEETKQVNMFSGVL